MRFERYVWSEEVSTLQRKWSARRAGNLLWRRCGRIYVSPSACSENLLASLPSPSLPLPSASALTLPSSAWSVRCSSARCPIAIQTDSFGRRTLSPVRRRISYNCAGLSSKKTCENACCLAFWLVYFSVQQGARKLPLPSRIPAGCARLWRTKTAIQRCGLYFRVIPDSEKTIEVIFPEHVTVRHVCDTEGK